MSGALKHDQEKIRMELIPGDALVSLAEVLTFGAKKYAAHNWAKGFDWLRLYGAAQRHLTSWQSGDDKDPETGFSHLAHAFCCIAFLIVHEKRGLGKDDRHRFERAAEEVMAAHQEVLKALADCPACGGARFVWADDNCDTKIDCGVCEP